MQYWTNFISLTGFDFLPAFQPPFEVQGFSVTGQVISSHEVYESVSIFTFSCWFVNCPLLAGFSCVKSTSVSWRSS